MKISVVTPTCRTEPNWLAQCLASVRDQTVPSTHFLVHDGDDSTWAAAAPGVLSLRIPGPHNDNGNAGRAIGSVCAIARDYDAIAYLDADNWFEPDHLQNLVELHRRTGAAVCSAARNLVDLEGRLLGVCPEVDGEEFVDTSSLFLTRAAFDLVAVWYRMPQVLAPACDRVMWKAIKTQMFSRAHHCKPTVNFRTQYLCHYARFGKPPPAKAKHIQVKMSPDGQYLSAETSLVDTRVPQPSQTAPLITRPAVSLCMIVKNEETHLETCLAPIADLFHDIIVVDTGSTDQTRECASRFGAKVIDFTWVDSFSAARNESLRHATGDWIFWLDGDEYLDEPNLQKLRRLLTTLPAENNAYMMSQFSAPDQLSGANMVVDQTRLFRKLPEARWSYRVHEQILLALRKLGAKEVRTDIIIGHLGYQDPATRASKRERNLRLLFMDLQENPNDGFSLFNVANSHMDAGQMDEGIRCMKSCLNYAPEGASYLPKAYALLAGAHHVLGHDEEALRYCREGKSRFPHAVDLWFREGMVLLARNDLAGARLCFETITELPSQLNYVGVDAGMAGCRTRHNLAFIYRRLGLRKRAEEQWLLAIQQTPHFEPAWLGLLELYLEQSRRADAEDLLQRLEGSTYHDAIFPALRARLYLADGKVAEARQVLEQALAANPTALWLRSLLADILLNVTDDDQAAEHHLRAIIALSPNEYQSQRKLAQLLAKNARKEA